MLFVLPTFNFGFGPLRYIGVNVPENFLNARSALGINGFPFVLKHTLMSFLLFKPEAYGLFFFSNGTMTLQGDISLLGVVLSLVLLWNYNFDFQR